MKKGEFFKKQKSDHGGSIKNPQKRQRPLSVKDSMHIVLKSSEAKGPYSFHNYVNEIEDILEKFANKYYIEVLEFANVGNHIHLNAVRLTSLF